MTAATLTRIAARCRDCRRRKRHAQGRCDGCHAAWRARLVPCAHCRRRAAGKSHRGLCLPCHRDPAVRERHPKAPGNRSGGESERLELGFKKPKEPQPTDALPGSPEKVSVLCARAERGEALFHRKDAGRGAR